MADRSFVGRGWRYPLRFDKRSGGVAKDQGSGPQQKLERVRMSILFIIRTQRGTLYFQRRLGARLHRLLFTLNTANLAQRLTYEVLRGLEDPVWGEKRALVDKVQVTPQTRRQPAAEIDVSFVLHGTNEEGNVVYPFYLLGAERSSAERSLDG